MKKKSKKYKQGNDFKDLLNLCDSLVLKGLFSEAIEKYKLALRLSSEKEPECEAVCHLKLGKLLF